MANKQFGFRVNPVLKKQMEARAKGLGVTVSEYLKDLVKADLKDASRKVQD